MPKRKMAGLGVGRPPDEGLPTATRGRPRHAPQTDPSRRQAIMARAVEPELGVSRRQSCELVVRAVAPGFTVAGIVAIGADGRLEFGVDIVSAAEHVSSFAVKVNSLQVAADRLFKRATIAESWALTHEISLCRAIIRGVRENKPLQIREAAAELRAIGWGPDLDRLVQRAAAIGAFGMPSDMPAPRKL